MHGVRLWAAGSVTICMLFSEPTLPPQRPSGRQSRGYRYRRVFRQRALEIFNDRYSYFLTFQQWAPQLRRQAGFCCRALRRIPLSAVRLYLWGAAYEFLSRSLDCYRMVVHYPGWDATI